MMTVDCLQARKDDDYDGDDEIKYELRFWIASFLAKTIKPKGFNRQT